MPFWFCIWELKHDLCLRFLGEDFFCSSGLLGKCWICAVLLNNPWWLPSSWYKLIQNIGCFTVYWLCVVMGIFTVLKIISWKVWWTFLTGGSKKWGSYGFLMLLNTVLWIQTCTIISVLWPVRSTEWRCRCLDFEEVKFMKQTPLQ